jgi:hypothetical protein
MSTCMVLSVAARLGSEYLRPRDYDMKTCKHDLGLQVVFRFLSKASQQLFMQRPEIVFVYKNTQVPLDLLSCSGVACLSSAALWHHLAELSSSYTLAVTEQDAVS